jgi:hypothetical protein
MKYILIYSFDKISPKKRLEFNRKLYGYHDFSNFGSYSYFREGILKPKSFQRLTKGVVLINFKTKKLLKLLKDFKAQHKIFKVVA